MFDKDNKGYRFALQEINQFFVIRINISTGQTSDRNHNDCRRECSVNLSFSRCISVNCHFLELVAYFKLALTSPNPRLIGLDHSIFESTSLPWQELLMNMLSDVRYLARNTDKANLHMAFAADSNIPLRD